MGYDVKSVIYLHRYLSVTFLLPHFVYMSQCVARLKLGKSHITPKTIYMCACALWGYVLRYFCNVIILLCYVIDIYI